MHFSDSVDGQAAAMPPRAALGLTDDAATQHYHDGRRKLPARLRAMPRRHIRPFAGHPVFGRPPRIAAGFRCVPP